MYLDIDPSWLVLVILLALASFIMNVLSLCYILQLDKLLRESKSYAKPEV